MSRVMMRPSRERNGDACFREIMLDFRAGGCSLGDQNLLTASPLGFTGIEMNRHRDVPEQAWSSHPRLGPGEVAAPVPVFPLMVCEDSDPQGRIA
eukprot:757809-Hanusia_phi.AAC.6